MSPKDRAGAEGREPAEGRGEAEARPEAEPDAATISDFACNARDSSADVAVVTSASRTVAERSAEASPEPSSSPHAASPIQSIPIEINEIEKFDWRASARPIVRW